MRIAVEGERRLFNKRLRLLATISLLSMIAPLAFSFFAPHMAFVIASDSMTPTLKPGDIVFASPSTGQIDVGTIIVFKSPFGGYEAHRVVACQQEGFYTRYFTKGDANTQTDSFLVPKEMVVGPVSQVIPELGLLFMIPREVMLALTLLLIAGYLFLAFKMGSTIDPSKPDARGGVSSNGRGKIITALCLVGLFVASSCAYSFSSIRLVYSTSNNTATLTTPKVILQIGTAGSSTIFDGGVNANVTVQANVQPWYDNNWNYRKAITFDHTKVPNTDQSNFPALISLASDANLQANARSDGYDILFTSADGLTKIPYEREKYTSATGALVAWVKVPTLSHLSNTVIYMYYGNPGAGDQQDKTNVWTSSYSGAWHLSEDPSGTAPQMKDSTSNNRGATSVGSMQSSQQVTGQIDGNLLFDGSNDGLNVASFTIGPSFTYEAWINAASVTGGDGWSNILTNNNYNRWLGLGNTGGTYGIIDFYEGGGVDNYFGTALSINTWYHVVATYDGTNLRVYLNGALLGTLAKSYTSQTSTFAIGYTRSNGIEYFAGKIDEARVSSVARPADWIVTEYNNQKNPSTFFSLGAQGTLPTYSYDYVLKAVNQVSQAWKVNLVSFSSSNLARLSSATISFHDGTTSDQIVVNNGAVTQSTGPQYDLTGLSTTYVSVKNVRASASGTSYLYVYLKILIPGSSVYALYTIKFIFT